MKLFTDTTVTINGEVWVSDGKLVRWRQCDENR